MEMSKKKKTNWMKFTQMILKKMLPFWNKNIMKPEVNQLTD